MRRFLVVGCGGSGGSTLAYMMDQLASDLAEHDVTSLPAGWQFVHLDVPAAEEPGPDGLGSVVEQGGRYLGLGPTSGAYSELDHAVSGRLQNNRALAEIGTWAPRDPRKVSTPISVGAGQYRTIGRMITLARADQVRSGLTQAWTAMVSNEATNQMRRTAAATGARFDPADKPIVLVVTSMAGGSGASMALDVCRILAQLSDHDPRLTAMFMASPDIFDVLPPSARSGVRANGLGMLGEIVASQTGAAREHDDAVLRGVGIQTGQGAEIPFARVFPVGRHVGAQRTVFGDGSQLSVYRGLARGLAGVMVSETATNQFVSYDLGNTGSIPPSLDPLGWGADPADSVPWGSFGFASLSMGRDRYEEYAAQRIARRSVDQLLDGHLQPGNPASGTEQVNALLDSQWSSICTATGLPDAGGGANLQQAVGSWMTGVVLPRADAEPVAMRIIDTDFVSQLSSPEGQQARQWLELADRRLAAQAPVLTESINAEAARWVFGWQRKLITAVEQSVSGAVARLGLAYAGGLIDRLGSYLGNVVIEGADGLARTSGGDLSELPPAVRTRLAQVKGAISGGASVVDSIVNDGTDGLRRKVINTYYRRVSELVATTLRSFRADVLPALSEAIRARQTELEAARQAPVKLDGLALLKTNQYAAWPSDSPAGSGDPAGQVPRRFDEADNEVLLTPSAHFPAQFVTDRRAAVPAEDRSSRQAESGIVIAGDPARTIAAQVIAGVWQTTGGHRPPAGLLVRTSEWRSRAFATDPGTGEAIVPSQARYDLHVRPAELLDRARSFVARPEESFNRFVSVSLRDHITGIDMNDNERELEQRKRSSEMVGKFGEALRLAMPLISVNEQVVRLLHGGDGVQYRYKFSLIPFAELSLADELRREITGNSAIDQSTRDNFTDALADQGDPRRIDIFGSYPLYSPLAFDAVLRPVAEQWSGSAPQARQAFWSYRRARPLPAALPMSVAERRAMVAGWYIGQIIGELRIPAPPYQQPVEVYDRQADRWIGFPNPLLTTPQQFLAKYDWLPAVLESVLIAIARVTDAPELSSLRPYACLRGLYDGNAGGPAAGITPLSGRELLAEWLRSGSSPGRESRIPALAAATTAEERHQLAKDWLVGDKGPGALAGVHFLSAGTDGAPGGGTFSEVDSRGQSAQAPIFRDLAPDIWWATRQLATLIDQAFEDQQSSTGSAGTPTGPRIDMPEGEVF